MKLPKADKLLNDKKVLYVVFVLAILNVLGYLFMQNTEAVAFFLIVGFLCTYFSKNMIIVLMIAIVSTSLFASTRTVSLIKEGMSNNRRAQKKSSETDTVFRLARRLFVSHSRRSAPSTPPKVFSPLYAMYRNPSSSLCSS